jgi:hypothetical protein
MEFNERRGSDSRNGESDSNSSSCSSGGSSDDDSCSGSDSEAEWRRRRKKARAAANTDPTAAAATTAATAQQHFSRHPPIPDAVAASFRFDKELYAGAAGSERFSIVVRARRSFFRSLRAEDGLPHLRARSSLRDCSSTRQQRSFVALLSWAHHTQRTQLVELMVSLLPMSEVEDRLGVLECLLMRAPHLDFVQRFINAGPEEEEEEEATIDGVTIGVVVAGATRSCACCAPRTTSARELARRQCCSNSCAPCSHGDLRRSCGRTDTCCTSHVTSRRQSCRPLELLLVRERRRLN